MKRVLAISSQVIRGHVGLSAICPTLTHLGFSVMPVPTVLLSNHPGHAQCARTIIPPSELRAMIAAIIANGWTDINAILTGYLPTAEHVAIAAETIDLYRDTASTSPPLVLCDPVIGDDPKGRYIDENAAAAIRRQLVPRASIITPNRFELAFLSGRPVVSVDDAVAAARQLPAPWTIATSIASGDGKLCNLAISPASICSADIAVQNAAPRGTGDTFAALMCAGHLNFNGDIKEVIARATSAMDKLVLQSAGSDELPIIQAGHDLRTALKSV